MTFAEVCSDCGDPIDTMPPPDDPQYDRFRGRCLACAVRVMIKTNQPDPAPRTRLFALPGCEPTPYDPIAGVLRAACRVLDEVPATCATGDGPVITWGALDALRWAVQQVET